MNCANCRYRGTEKIVKEWDEVLEKDVVVNTGFFPCTRILHEPTLIAKLERSYAYAGDPKPKSLAIVVDGSGYAAQLLVRNEFGCKLFEPRE